MIKLLQILPLKSCVALFLAAFAVCMLGGAATDQPEWIRSGLKIAQNRGRPGKPEESDEMQATRKAAEAGDIAAQLHLAFEYSEGGKLAKNDAEAAKWCHLAADQKNAAAECSLGFMYYTGTGVVQNFTEAAKWLRRAAEQGHTTAQAGLGALHVISHGVPKDYAEAIKLISPAAKRGDASAQLFFGLMHSSGIGVPQNNQEAYIWLNLAAASGNENAIKMRDDITPKLSPAELASAQEEATRRYAEIQSNLEKSAETETV